MIKRLAGLRGRVSSHWLASAVASGYLLASVALGVILLSRQDDVPSAAAPAASTPTYPFDESTTTAPPYVSDAPDVPDGPDSIDDYRTHGRPTRSSTTHPRTTTTPPPTAPAPAGFQRVNGPAGVQTVIPAGWRPTRTSGPGAMEAADPAGNGRFVKFGGSDAPTLGIDTSHVQYENGFAVRTPDYRRIVLASAKYAGHEAVEWEFEARDAGGLAHVRSLYWRVGSKEYFLLASAPAAQWPQMKPIYDAMVANADP